MTPLLSCKMVNRRSGNTSISLAVLTTASTFSGLSKKPGYSYQMLRLGFVQASAKFRFSAARISAPQTIAIACPPPQS
jgi:hypothetical protein